MFRPLPNSKVTASSSSFQLYVLFSPRHVQKQTSHFLEPVRLPQSLNQTRVIGEICVRGRRILSWKLYDSSLFLFRNCECVCSANFRLSCVTGYVPWRVNDPPDSHFHPFGCLWNAFTISVAAESSCIHDNTYLAFLRRLLFSFNCVDFRCIWFVGTDLVSRRKITRCTSGYLKLQVNKENTILLAVRSNFVSRNIFRIRHCKNTFTSIASIRRHSTHHTQASHQMQIITDRKLKNNVASYIRHQYHGNMNIFDLPPVTKKKKRYHPCSHVQ
jgi:hypothetical protein